MANARSSGSIRACSSRRIAAPKDGRDTSQPSDTSVTRYMRPTRIARLSSAPGRQVMHRVCCRHDGWPRSLRLRDLATTSTSAVSHAKSRLDRLQSPSVPSSCREPRVSPDEDNRSGHRSSNHDHHRDSLRLRRLVRRPPRSARQCQTKHGGSSSSPGGARGSQRDHELS